MQLKTNDSSMLIDTWVAGDIESSLPHLLTVQL